jgi:hypothetical protein
MEYVYVVTHADGHKTHGYEEANNRIAALRKLQELYGCTCKINIFLKGGCLDVHTKNV